MVNTGIEVLAHRDPAQRNLSALEEANFRGKSPVAGAYRAASYRGDFKRPTWADRWEPRKRKTQVELPMLSRPV